MRIPMPVIMLIALLSCHKKKPIPSDSEVFAPAKPIAELNNKKLMEVSGLAASANNPGLLWAHNDSGNGPVVYLVDENIKIKLTCTIQGVKNRDWEDVTVGPGPVKGKNYLYIGDIGDNDARHPFKYIYWFEEPDLNNQRGEIKITAFNTIVFRLEDGKKDAEALMINPKTKNLYIVSKRETPVYLYELKYPFRAQDTLTAAKVTSLPLTQIVAASISADGKEILMKNYENIYYWNGKGKSIENVLQEKPQILRYSEEPQGEAITFTRDGAGFYTLSEKLKSEKTFLNYYERLVP